jgi:aminoglycoside/choline kinase family phosphotransferase
MTEGRFFRELAGELDVRLPRCFYAGYDERQGIVLMEDLTAGGVEFCRSTKRVPVDLVAASNSNLARLHARWWGNGQLDRWDWIQMPLQEDTGLQYFRTTSNPELIARRLASHSGEVVPAEVKDPDAIYGSMLELVPLIQRRPHCLLHADPHIGNVYFSPASGPGFVDFQQVRKGYWAFDYTYHVVSALDPEDRRRNEAALLREYLAELATLGVDAPAFDDAWLDYRRNVAYGLIAWLCNPEFCQPEDINVATAGRFAAAAADLETFRSF